jgi:hypothetical protein
MGRRTPEAGPHAGARPGLPDRIVFVLKTGIQWEYVPQGMGCGSGMACGPGSAPACGTGCTRLLQRLADAGRIDRSRASADAARVPAKVGGWPVRARDTVRQRAAITRR